MNESKCPLVGVIMGSTSDLEVMKNCTDTLETLQIPYEVRVISAHRTPKLLTEYAESAAARGLEILVAGAGGAAHLPGVIAAQTLLPVLGIPMESQYLKGIDSLYSIVQMPGGVPVGTLGIGKAGAKNAALLCGAILGLKHPEIAAQWKEFRAKQTAKGEANSFVQS